MTMAARWSAPLARSASTRLWAASQLRSKGLAALEAWCCLPGCSATPVRVAVNPQRRSTSPRQLTQHVQPRPMTPTTFFAVPASRKGARDTLCMPPASQHGLDTARRLSAWGGE